MTKNCDSPPSYLIHKTFWYPKFFETKEASPTNFFGTVRQTLEKNRDKAPLHFSIKISDTRSFLNWRRVPLRKFSVLWDEDFDKKLWYNPLFSYPKNFSIPEVFWNRDVFPYVTTGLCGTKKIAGNRDIPFLCKNFFHTRFFLKHRRFLLRFFWYCETKILTKTCDTNPLLLSYKIFDTRNFSETQKGSSTKFFGTVRQNSFCGKSWYPPPLLSLTLFDTRSFLKHRRVFQRLFW